MTTSARRAANVKAMKALQALRRGAQRCIYDRRDTGGPGHGPLAIGGRCAVCHELQLLSGQKRRRERRLEALRATRRATKDPLYKMRLKERIAKIKPELEVIRTRKCVLVEQLQRHYPYEEQSPAEQHAGVS